MLISYVNSILKSSPLLLGITLNCLIFLSYNSFGILKNILNDSFSSDSLINVSINLSSNICLNTLLVLVKPANKNQVIF